MHRLVPTFMLCLIAGGAMATGADHLHVSQAWIRLLPGNLPAGAYAELHNDGDTPVVVRDVISADYGSAMLHQSSENHGMSQMVMVDTITVPAHGVLKLSPGGYHVMLMEPKHALRAGDTVTLRFVLNDGSHVSTPFAVQSANATGSNG